MAIATGAAILGGSIIAAGAGLIAGKQAADAQVESTGSAISAQQDQFAETQANLQPSLEAGNLAREEQLALMGLRGTEAEESAFASFEISPGQQFLRDRAQKNLTRNASRIGGLGGGNVRKALVRQGVGFAQQDFENRFGRLGQIAGQGQSAANSIGSFGQTTASNVGNAMISGGDDRATGILNQNTAIQSGISGVATGLSQGGMINTPIVPPPTVGSGVQNIPTGFQQ